MTQDYYTAPTLVGAHQVNFDKKNQIVNVLVHVNESDLSNFRDWYQTYHIAVFPAKYDITKQAIYDLLKENYPNSYSLPLELYIFDDFSRLKSTALEDNLIETKNLRVRCDFTSPAFAPTPGAITEDFRKNPN